LKCQTRSPPPLIVNPYKWWVSSCSITCSPGIIISDDISQDKRHAAIHATAVYRRHRICFSLLHHISRVLLLKCDRDAKNKLVAFSVASSVISFLVRALRSSVSCYFRSDKIIAAVIPDRISRSPARPSRRLCNIHYLCALRVFPMVSSRFPFYPYSDNA